jgi:hypothetical protein
VRFWKVNSALVALQLSLFFLLAPNTFSAEVDPSKLKSATLEIDWEYAEKSKRLRLSIPREYIKEVYRDRTGEAEKIRGIKNNGIEIVRLEAWLPNLMPHPLVPIPEAERGTPEYERRLDALALRLPVRLDASGGINILGMRRSTVEAPMKRKWVYRVGDIAGLEHFRRMICGKLEPNEERKAKYVDDSAPDGCRDSGMNEIYVSASSSGLDGAYISCVREFGGMCEATVNYQEFWMLKYHFPKRKIQLWQDYDKAARRLVDQFLVRQTMKK